MTLANQTKATSMTVLVAICGAFGLAACGGSPARTSTTTTTETRQQNADGTQIRREQVTEEYQPNNDPNRSQQQR